MAKGQFHINQEIETFIRDQDAGGRSYSAEQIAFINQYTGSGGMGSKGASGQGLLYEFFTPDYIIELMWELARHHGFTGRGSVLEPGLGTGRFLQYAPDKSKCVGFEINETSARIAELTYPGARVFNHYFETAFLAAPRYSKRITDKQRPTWLEAYPFELVIGNPPYGIHQNEYSPFFPESKREGTKQIELFFMVKGLQLLQSGGLLVFITGSNFLRNGMSYDAAKTLMGTLADLVDAYRLPPVFETSKVPTDILVFRRK